MKTIFLIRHSKKEAKSYSSCETIDEQTFDEQKKLNEEGRNLALKLSKLDILKGVKEVWASNYERAIETAKLITDEKINITNSFDERHYGTFSKDADRDEFWANQFSDENLKNINGESQKEVRKRFEEKINYILENSCNDKIIVVSHNAAILFYLLKYCDLLKAESPKKLTIKYKNKILINEGLMKSPSIMKVLYDDDNNLIDIDYIEI